MKNWNNWNNGTRSAWNVKVIGKVRRSEECSLSYKTAIYYIIPRQTMARLAGLGFLISKKGKIIL